MWKKATRGRKGMNLLSDLMKGRYVAHKIMADDRKEWQKLELEVPHLLLSRLLE